MPLPRFAKLPEKAQARLLDAATREFAAHGYDEASLNRVLETAGISKGALYYYFADRDDLYATVVERVLMSFGAEMLDGFAPRTRAGFWADIEQLSIRAVELARQRPLEISALRAFQRDLRRNDKPAFAGVRELIRTRFRLLVQTGQRLGCVRTDLSEDMLVELLESIDAVIDSRLFDARDGLKSAHKLAALSIDLGRRLVEPRSRGRKEKRS